MEEVLTSVPTSHHSSSLTDRQYFELKSRQDYTIAAGSVLIALFSLLGYGTLNDIKKDYQIQADAERKQVDSLTQDAIKRYLTYENLDSLYKGSVNSGLANVELLKRKVAEILSKDLIKQNIYIVDPIKMGDYKYESDAFRTIYFKDLKTISGQKLPIFTAPPSLICFSSNYAVILTKDVTNVSFRVRPELESSQFPQGDDIKFGVWISQKLTQ